MPRKSRSKSKSKASSSQSDDWMSPPKSEKSDRGSEKEGAKKDESKPSSTVSQSEGEGEKLPMLCSYWPRAASKKDAARMIAVVRSAERAVRVFGSDWPHTEAPHGYLVPTDLNIPNNPCSKSFLESGVFNENPPITAFGKYTIQLTARALANRGVKSKKLICSPTLRSIQTAEALAKFLKAKIAVEPGLLEPLAWYRMTNKKMPDFHLGELAKSYPIDTN
ncbi:hypothetical protein TELCIR_00470 [Teladorsagia circumcincta]|uniref:Uncharacterized protein n=1 Tax=Teladorsagia circumcincta TaxID=45464 RepID=A0A2G9V4M0_TELCI|nr:hypothetical protein TELCIR_00470 [Teladorsagia circumcincta]